MDPHVEVKFMVEHMVGHTMPNKWMIDGYSGYGLGLTLVWDVPKIFIQFKAHQSKNMEQKIPTMSSNSWGYRATPKQ